MRKNNSRKSLRIALMGTRGIPASYSGFETCVEQLGQRLVRRGHEVDVYCRKHFITYQDSHYLGMRLIKLPTIANKYLDTIVHTFLSSMYALTKGYDICLYFIAGNSLVSWIPRVVGSKTIINVDGLDWKRDKWPRLARKYIQFSEYLATYLPNGYLTDSKVVQSYYRERYDSNPSYIPYGSEVNILLPGETLNKFNLRAGEYIMFVGRLVPENCVHHLVEAFKDIETNLKCVIVGDSSYADNYKQELYKLAEGDPRIIFTGYVFGEGYYELGSNALIFVETSGVGGTHPALVEAMAFGNCVVVNDTQENLETISDAGFPYDGKNGSTSLQHQLEHLLNEPELINEFKDKAKLRAQECYSWDTMTDLYEQLFRDVICGNNSKS